MKGYEIFIITISGVLGGIIGGLIISLFVK